MRRNWHVNFGQRSLVGGALIAMWSGSEFTIGDYVQLMADATAVEAVSKRHHVRESQ